MFTRPLALTLALWLGALPAVLSSRSLLDLYVELEVNPLPLTEEEEVEKTCTFGTCAWSFPEPNSSGEERAYQESDERLLAVPHGEVAYPPPRRA